MRATIENVDVKSSIADSVKEVKEIRKGKLPKRSWREMMARVKEELNKE